MKKLFSLFLLWLGVLTTATAQMVDPVVWTASSQVTDGQLVLTFTAKIESGWHLYDLTVPDGGPQRTEVTYETLQGVRQPGAASFVAGKAISEYDETFEMQLTYYEQSATLRQVLPLAGGAYDVEGYLTFMACCDGMCTPPTRHEFRFRGEGAAPAAIPAGKPADTVAGAAGGAAAAAPSSAAPSFADASGAADASVADADAAAADAPVPAESSAAAEGGVSLWTPVIAELQAYQDGATGDASGLAHSWWYILVAGFLAGLLALVTPCVWPMIPMTVSFFLKRTKDRRKSIRDAVTYGICIIVVYVGLGLVVTALFGASALNSLATNAVFNIIFFLLLVVFAISFFGAFELTLPESWTSRLDAKADATTGLLSIFFMAFTLCLVSFSCTGPIIGTLLVEAATSGSMLYPAIGMFGFALALSLPFTLFALFPSMLKAMPKSGGWLNMVKVVLGFCELALSLKFLSVADLAYGWGLLDREVFLCLWIVIFLLLGLYLLGMIRLPHDSDPDPSDRVSVSRLMLAMVSLSFALYMVPGLWGAPCKAISAFTPPITTQDFRLGEQPITTYHDYDEGMAAAARLGKPVLVDFSGYGCVNCRKMEAAVWTDPTVRQLMEEEYILIELMVDDKTPLPGGTQVVEEAGRDVKLRTVGDKWSYLQRVKFGANAQPFYVLLDAEGRPLTGAYSYNEDVAAYVEFLRAGLDRR